MSNLSITKEDFTKLADKLDEAASQIKDPAEQKQFYDDALSRIQERFVSEAPWAGDMFAAGAKASEVVAESDKRRGQLISQSGSKEAVAPGGFLEETGKALMQSIPGVATGQAVMGDATGADVAGAVAGDIGGTAALGAGIATGGIGPLMKATGAGAVVQGAMESSGFNPMVRSMAAEVEESFDRGTATDFPSEVAGVEGLGTVVNAVTRIPGATASTVINLLPVLVAAFTGGSVASATKKISGGLAASQEAGGLKGTAAGAARGVTETLTPSLESGQAIKLREPQKMSKEQLNKAIALQAEKSLPEAAPSVTERLSQAGTRGEKLGSGGLIEASKGLKSRIGKEIGDIVEDASQLGLKKFTNDQVTILTKKRIAEALPEGDILIDPKTGKINVGSSIDRVSANFAKRIYDQIDRQDVHGQPSIASINKTRRFLDKEIERAIQNDKNIPSMGTTLSLRKALDNAEMDLVKLIDETGEMVPRLKDLRGKYRQFKVYEETLKRTTPKKGQFKGPFNAAKYAELLEENKDLLEGIYGKDRYKKMSEFFNKSKNEAGKVKTFVRVLRLGYELVRQKISVGAKRGDDIVQILLEEGGAQAPKAFLNEIDNLDPYVIAKATGGDVTLKAPTKPQKMMDAFFQGQQQARAQESKRREEKN